VLRRPVEDRPAYDGVRVAIGPTQAGRCLRVIYVADPEPDSVFCTSAPPAQAAAMSSSRFPEGWDAARVARVLRHHGERTDEESVAADEAACEAPDHTVMEVPVELVPAVRELIAERRAS
jgi:hypothetical protein